jgi:hypothetical protein
MKVQHGFLYLTLTSARIYRPSFRENKPKTLVYKWVYKFGHRQKFAVLSFSPIFLSFAVPSPPPHSPALCVPYFIENGTRAVRGGGGGCRFLPDTYAAKMFWKIGGMEFDGLMKVYRSYTHKLYSAHTLITHGSHTGMMIYTNHTLECRYTLITHGALTEYILNTHRSHTEKYCSQIGL